MSVVSTAVVAILVVHFFAVGITTMRDRYEFFANANHLILPSDGDIKDSSKTTSYDVYIVFETTEEYSFYEENNISYKDSDEEQVLEICKSHFLNFQFQEDYPTWAHSLQVYCDIYEDGELNTAYSCTNCLVYDQLEKTIYIWYQKF